MMNDQDIQVLKQAVLAGGVYWRDRDGTCHRVLSVNLNWVEFKGDKHCAAEPAALIEGGMAAALYCSEQADFVTLNPVFRP